MADSTDLALVALGMVTSAVATARGHGDPQGDFAILGVVTEGNDREELRRQMTAISATLASIAAELLLTADKAKPGFADSWLRNVGRGWAAHDNAPPA